MLQDLQVPVGTSARILVISLTAISELTQLLMYQPSDPFQSSLVYFMLPYASYMSEPFGLHDFITLRILGECHIMKIHVV